MPGKGKATKNRDMGTDGFLMSEEQTAAVRRAEAAGIDTIGYKTKQSKWQKLDQMVDDLKSFEESVSEKPSTELSTYVDKAMFDAEEIDKEALRAPKVYLLSATPDPLGTIAATMMMYEGRVIRDLSEITNQERKQYFEECFKTALRAPFETVKFHLMVEGVTRSHTHQEVRQRTAMFAQESMRFAVKDNLRESVRPGPITQSRKDATERYFRAIDAIEDYYKWAIGNQIPAEEARGILPHDTLTRVHHVVDLRNLIDELGKRTCTQAQFEWRMWATSLREAIRKYQGGFVPYGETIRTEHMEWEFPDSGYVDTDSPDVFDLDNTDVGAAKAVRIHHDDAEGYYTGWQFKLIADSPIFQPICFNTGRCMFKAKMDRGCTIRERVEAGKFDEIKVEEWLMDPTAGWVK